MEQRAAPSSKLLYSPTDMAAKTKPQEKIVRSQMQELDMEIVNRLDLTVSKALDIGETGATFAQAVVVAEAMAELREAITGPILQRFKSLSNSRLGFLTDKDPNKWNGKLNKGQGGYSEPYKDEVLRECMIEACLRGLLPIGNQFNIIAGSVYTTKEGYKAQLKKLKGLTDFAPLIGTPRITQGSQDFFVRCKATCMLHGVEVKIGVDDDDIIEIAVSPGAFATTDSTKGKAERKFLKIVFERLTGIETPDGDITEAHQIAPPAPTQGTLAGPVTHMTATEANNLPSLTASPEDCVLALLQLCIDTAIEEHEFCRWAEANKFTGAGCSKLAHLVDACPSKLGGFIDKFEEIAQQIIEMEAPQVS